VKVAVIGLGRIGGGVSHLLAAAGHEVRGTDPRPEAYAGFEGTVAGSPAEAADGADCALIAVFDDAQVRAALDDLLEADVPVAVVLSTVTVETVRHAHEKARAHGISLLDCGVSGGKEILARRRMAASVGGDREAFEAVRPVLEAYADPVLYMGPSGSGMAAKIARNMLHFCSVLADAESLRLAAAAGLDAAAFRDFVLAADRNSRGRMGYGDLEHDAGLLGYGAKDLAAATELAARLGATLPQAGAAAEAYAGLLRAAERSGG
jgi:3-hydroxyisobutyrate dehydrogenase